MNWEDKVKMVEFGNRIYDSKEDRIAFQMFVLAHVDEFDGQAWDMFSNIISISIDEMKEDVDFWKTIYKHVDCNAHDYGLRSAMRLAMIETICEDELNLTK